MYNQPPVSRNLQAFPSNCPVLFKDQSKVRISTGKSSRLSYSNLGRFFFQKKKAQPSSTSSNQDKLFSSSIMNFETTCHNLFLWPHYQITNTKTPQKLRYVSRLYRKTFATCFEPLPGDGCGYDPHRQHLSWREMMCEDDRENAILEISQNQISKWFKV